MSGFCGRRRKTQGKKFSLSQRKAWWKGMTTYVYQRRMISRRVLQNGRLQAMKGRDNIAKTIDRSTATLDDATA